MYNRLQPNQNQFATLASRAADGPVVMVNQLKFKPNGGKESYQAYMVAVAPLLAEVGGEVVYMGRGAENLIGNSDDAWDMVLLVRYPHRGALLRLSTSEAYRKIAHLREEALAAATLLVTEPVDPAPANPPR